MKEAGLETIAMGVESGDVDVRKIIRKTSSLETTEQAFKIASENGINTLAYFMIGFPGESYEQASRTLDLVEKLRPDIPCISICIPYPGTDSYLIAVEMKSIEDTDSIDWSKYYHHSNINFSGKISNEEWTSLLSRCNKIEQKAREKRDARKIESMFNNITLNNVIKRYTKKPYIIFSDCYNLAKIIISKL